jgi:hypothetical protein
MAVQVSRNTSQQRQALLLAVVAVVPMAVVLVLVRQVAAMVEVTIRHLRLAVMEQPTQVQVAVGDMQTTVVTAELVSCICAISRQGIRLLLLHQVEHPQQQVITPYGHSQLLAHSLWHRNDNGTFRKDRERQSHASYCCEQ